MSMSSMLQGPWSQEPYQDFLYRSLRFISSLAEDNPLFMALVPPSGGPHRGGIVSSGADGQL